MAGKRITVVISQSQSKNPARRQLEEEIVTRLMLGGEVEVSLVPHLYDLTADHSGMLFLKGISGDLVVLSWLYPRAARWILDRNGIKGQEGVSALREEGDDENVEETVPSADVIGSLNPPNRTIYAIDLRLEADPTVFLEEIGRIARSSSVKTVPETVPKMVPLIDWIGGNPCQEQLQRDWNSASPRNGHAPVNENGVPVPIGGPAKRRWYPVIDYSRCTNCMECIDFCLFGVYGVDRLDRILVEQQDNCKKGCPACSRVCPANAIVFPGHKSPAIAGSDAGGVANMKIDLSKLFGAPTALELAAAERDTELVADGRDAVGTVVGIPKRQVAGNGGSRDALDDLMDGLDDLDL